jgi:MFS family permease
VPADNLPAAGLPQPTASIRRRIVATLFASGALNRTGFIASITVATLVAEDLLDSASLSGLAPAMATIGLAVGTTPMAALMARRGRRVGIMAGLSLGALGAAVAAASTQWALFLPFVVGMGLYGIGNSGDRLARYAAADVTPAARQAGAIGLVVWAGTVGSVAGPALLQPIEAAAGGLGLEGLAGPYLLALVLQVVAVLLIFAGLRPEPLKYAPPIHREHRDPWAARRWLAYPKVRVAIVALLTGQTVMVLIMTMTPIHIRRAGEDLGIVGLVIAAHTLGMFAFSPITGWLGDRFGRMRVVLVGQGLLVVSAGMAAFAAGDDRVLLVVSLYLLGLGWNLGFVAGSALVTEDVPVEARVGLQGLADTAVWTSGALASLASGVLLEFGSYTILSVIGAALVVWPVWVFARNRTAALAMA